MESIVIDVIAFVFVILVILAIVCMILWLFILYLQIGIVMWLVVDAFFKIMYFIFLYFISKLKMKCTQYAVSRRLMKILIIIVMLLSPLGGVWFAMLMQRKEGSIKESYWRVMMIISGCWAIYVVTFQFFQRHYIFLGINMFFLICVIELYCKRHKPLKKFKR